MRAIRSMRLFGTYRGTQVFSTDREGVTRITDRTAPVEIRFLFPDRYLQIQNDGRFERRYGFAGDVLLNGLASLDGGQAGSHFEPDAINLERQTFARLLAGLLARSDGSHDLKARIELDTATGRVARIVSRGKVRPRPLGEILKGRMSGPGPSTAPETDITMAFADHRSVDGVLVPHHITSMALGILLWEMRFDNVVINGPMTAADFQK